ncbi:MAG: hypothetical protein WCK42_04555 [Myxococcaceae bacterium]
MSGLRAQLLEAQARQESLLVAEQDKNATVWNQERILKFLFQLV